MNNAHTPKELRDKYTVEWRGDTSGKDPRTMTKEEFAELGHEHKPLIRIIRDRCIDCCAFNESEVRRCVSFSCPSWPYRMGTNPLRDKKVMTEEQRAAMAERLAGGRKKIHGDKDAIYSTGGETMGP